MTAETISIHVLKQRPFPALSAVCSFGSRTVFSAKRGRQYWLVMLNAPAMEATVCEYDDWKEWQAEMAVLRRAAQDGDEGGPPDMGVTANLSPSPPSTPASSAHTIPVPSNRMG